MIFLKPKKNSVRRFKTFWECLTSHNQPDISADTTPVPDYGLGRSFSRPPISLFIRRLTQLIEEHIDDETYGIDQLCRDAGASRTQIHNKVKRWTGRSTSKFIRKIRLQKAEELLLTSDLNISQVAYEVGFSDSHYFSRVFSDSYGLCPRAFRSGAFQCSVV